MKSINDLKRFSKEWWKNFFFYYKWHLLIAVVAIGMIGWTVTDIVTHVEPDLYLLFSGNYVLTEEDLAILTSRSEQVISDINEDGKTVTRLVEIPLLLNSEKVDETTAPANLQMQMQFTTGEAHIMVLDRELFELYDEQGLLDTETLCIQTKDCAFFQGTTLEHRDTLMVTRVKRHDLESDFTTSQQFIDYWTDK